MINELALEISLVVFLLHNEAENTKTRSTLKTEYEATSPERERLPSLKGGKDEFKRYRKP